MNSTVFSRVGILKIIDPLKHSSSVGVDEVNSEVLKNTRVIISAILCLIFSQSHNTGVVPDDWRTGNIIPVFKKGDKYSAFHYRPISVFQRK